MPQRDQPVRHGPLAGQRQFASAFRSEQRLRRDGRHREQRGSAKGPAQRAGVLARADRVGRNGVDRPDQLHVDKGAQVDVEQVVEADP